MKKPILIEVDDINGSHWELRDYYTNNILWNEIVEPDVKYKFCTECVFLTHHDYSNSPICCFTGIRIIYSNIQCHCGKFKLR